MLNKSKAVVEKARQKGALIVSDGGLRYNARSMG
jgi:hypothetical protein